MRRASPALPAQRIRAGAALGVTAVVVLVAACSPGAAPAPEQDSPTATLAGAASTTPVPSPSPAATATQQVPTAGPELTNTATATPGQVPTTSASPAVTPNARRVSLLGVFAPVIGDPLPGSNGEAKFAATLTDDAGVEWRLLFDAYTSRPPGPLIQLNGVRVRIEGQLVDAAHNEVLVELMTPD